MEDCFDTDANGDGVLLTFIVQYDECESSGGITVRDMML
jgi:hypothetical protein